ncbi:EKC/KEOPS complex subunit Cgi121p [Monosporozyma unispora]|nr:hypothetical protein C6P44_001522 [Kazachstania unispora]
MIQTTIPQFPDFTLKISLFKDVINSAEIRSKIADYPFAFIDAKTICSVEQLMAALYRVFIEKNYNRIRTKSLTSECLLCLAPTSNIGEAFRRFGLKDDTKEVICVQIIPTEDLPLDEVDISSLIDGFEVDMNDEHLKQFCDKNIIREIYKFDASFQPNSIEEVTRAVVSAIQLRGM